MSYDRNMCGGAWGWSGMAVGIGNKKREKKTMQENCYGCNKTSNLFEEVILVDSTQSVQTIAEPWASWAARDSRFRWKAMSYKVFQRQLRIFNKISDSEKYEGLIIIT